MITRMMVTMRPTSPYPYTEFLQARYCGIVILSKAKDPCHMAYGSFGLRASG